MLGKYRDEDIPAITQQDCVFRISFQDWNVCVWCVWIKIYHLWKYITQMAIITWPNIMFQLRQVIGKLLEFRGNKFMKFTM